MNPPKSWASLWIHYYVLLICVLLFCSSCVTWFYGALNACILGYLDIGRSKLFIRVLIFISMSSSSSLKRFYLTSGQQLYLKHNWCSTYKVIGKQFLLEPIVETNTVAVSCLSYGNVTTYQQLMVIKLCCLFQVSQMCVQYGQTFKSKTDIKDTMTSPYFFNCNHSLKPLSCSASSPDKQWTLSILSFCSNHSKNSFL